MRLIVVCVLAILTSKLHAEDYLEKTSWRLLPDVYIGLSYPLVTSASLGVLAPIERQSENTESPSSISMLADVDIGVGGSAIGLGVLYPFDDIRAIRIKAVKMRTWLLDIHGTDNGTYDGGAIEYSMYHVHGRLKVGVGFFREVDNTDNSFVSIFYGIGW